MDINDAFIEKMLASESQLIAEIDGWIKHLNNVFGIVMFGFALASLGTKFPALFAGLSFLIVFNINYKSQKFPPALMELRKIGKHHAVVNDFVTKIDRKCFPRFFAFTKGLPFMIGYMVTCFVIIAPCISKYVPLLFWKWFM